MVSVLTTTSELLKAFDAIDSIFRQMDLTPSFKFIYSNGYIHIFIDDYIRLELLIKANSEYDGTYERTYAYSPLLVIPSEATIQIVMSDESLIMQTPTTMFSFPASNREDYPYVREENSPMELANARSYLHALQLMSTAARASSFINSTSNIFVDNGCMYVSYPTFQFKQELDFPLPHQFSPIFLKSLTTVFKQAKHPRVEILNNCIKFDEEGLFSITIPITNAPPNLYTPNCDFVAKFNRDNLVQLLTNIKAKDATVIISFGGNTLTVEYPQPRCLTQTIIHTETALSGQVVAPVPLLLLSLKLLNEEVTLHWQKNLISLSSAGKTCLLSVLN